MVTEAKLLRQHKGRLEARMQILEDHNKQLEAQLQRLRQLLHEVLIRFTFHAILHCLLKHLHSEFNNMFVLHLLYVSQQFLNHKRCKLGPSQHHN